MADIYGSHFDYDNKSSAEYDLIMVNIETERYLKLSSEVESVTFFNRANNQRHLLGDNLDEELVKFEVELVRRDMQPISRTENREITKWLFNRKKYSKLYINDYLCIDNQMSEFVDGEEKRLYLNCRFINPEKIESSGVLIGYKATLEADSNMFWQDEITKHFTLNGSQTNEISIETDTDEDDYIYPTVKVVMGTAGGHLEIINNTDSSERKTVFNDLIPSATFTMRGGGLNYVTGGYYEKFELQNFIRLLDGVNNITVKGDVKDIEFVYQNRRMM